MSDSILKNPILYGTIIGCSEHLLILPFRTILDHQQLNPKSVSVYNIWKQNYTNKLSSLYKGTSVCLSGVALGHIGLFSMLEYTKQYPSFLSSILLGALGKCIHDTCIVPGDTIRMYSNIHSITPSNAYKEILTKYGYKGFFKGLPLALSTNIPAGMIEFGTFYLLGGPTFINGAIAGGINSILISPIDTMKSILQVKQVSLMTAIKECIHTRGYASLFRGIPNRIISTSLSYGLYSYFSALHT